MSVKDLSELRQNYGKGSLLEQDLSANPSQQFLSWLDVALQAQVTEPYAMTLATANAKGQPHARTVLLRGADESGFYFYTNYDSQKGQDLSANPYAELLFFWPALEQQVRIGGKVIQLSEQQSSEYFHKRPRDSQIAAHVSTPQSGQIASRDVLEQRFTDLAQKYQSGDEVAKPEFWGGYCLKPEYFEFWQGRPNRMHDRLKYLPDPVNNTTTSASTSASNRQSNDTAWRIERLMP